MHQRVLRTLRHLAGLISHQTARTNAAEASDTLRKRRQDQEHVDEYLQGRLLASPMGEPEKEEPGVREAEHHP